MHNGKNQYSRSSMGTPRTSNRRFSGDGEDDFGYYSANEGEGSDHASGSASPSSNQYSREQMTAFGAAAVAGEIVSLEETSKTPQTEMNDPLIEIEKEEVGERAEESGSPYGYSALGESTGRHHHHKHNKVDRIFISASPGDEDRESKDVDQEKMAVATAITNTNSVSTSPRAVPIAETSQGQQDQVLLSPQESHFSMPGKTVIWDRKMSGSPKFQLLDMASTHVTSATDHPHQHSSNPYEVDLAEASDSQPPQSSTEPTPSSSRYYCYCFPWLCHRSEKPPSRPRRYQVWPGRNYFLCYGRILLGVHINHLTQTIILISCTWVFYIALVAPFISPYNEEASLIALAFLVINTSLLIATATTDPGIVPRRDRKYVRDLLRAYGLPVQGDANVEDDLMRRVASTKGRQYCASCQIIRPKRTKHCKHCDNCVRIFDHHCPWTGTCIGQRNYALFLCFVCSIILAACYFLLSTVLLLLGWIFHYHTDAPYTRVIALIIGISWSLILLCLVGMLLVFHTMLMRKGMTTSEFLRNAPRHHTGDTVSTSHHGGAATASTSGSPLYLAERDAYCCPIAPTLLLPMWDFVTPEDYNDYHDDDFDIMDSSNNGNVQVDKSSEQRQGSSGCCDVPSPSQDSVV